MDKFVIRKSGQNSNIHKYINNINNGAINFKIRSHIQFGEELILPADIDNKCLLKLLWEMFEYNYAWKITQK